MGQNSNSSLPLTQRGLPVAEYKRLSAKCRRGETLTQEEHAAMKADTDAWANRFMQALKEGIRNKVPTP